MSQTVPVLLDERARPDLRHRIGGLLAEADTAAFAVARIRLGVLDLSEQELARLRHCRVLLGQLDASTLLDAAEQPATRPTPTLGPLLRFARSGRLEVRSAGLCAWAPDFAVVRHGGGCVGFLGSIQFGNPELVMGPSFTMSLTDRGTVARLLDRFDEIWERSHDVLPAIQEVLQRGYGMEPPAAAEGGRNHPGHAVP